MEEELITLIQMSKLYDISSTSLLKCRACDTFPKVKLKKGVQKYWSRKEVEAWLPNLKKIIPLPRRGANGARTK